MRHSARDSHGQKQPPIERDQIELFGLVYDVSVKRAFAREKLSWLATAECNGRTIESKGDTAQGAFEAWRRRAKASIL